MSLTGRSEYLANKKILLIESSVQKKFTLGETHEIRTCALNPSAKSLLQSLGTWERIEAARLRAVKKMQVYLPINTIHVTHICLGLFI